MSDVEYKLELIFLPDDDHPLDDSATADTDKPPDYHRKRRHHMPNLRLCLAILICCAAVLVGIYSANLRFRSGDVSHAGVIKIESGLYSDEEITAAVRVIEDEFAKNWTGCSLTKIGYAGDGVSRWETKKRGIPAIVLISDFVTRHVPDDSELQDRTVYTNQRWILVRDVNEQWIYVAHELS